MPSPPLRIALIEPEPAHAAELGQILSDELRDCSVELSDLLTADLILLDDAALDPARPDHAAPLPPASAHVLVIHFGRSQDGSYFAHTVHSSCTPQQPLILRVPLTDSIRCAALMWNAWRASSQTHDTDSVAAQSARFQQRLLQLQKMEAVGELAGGIAHDFNNLLLVVRSYAEMLLDDTDLSADARHNASEIVAAARRASDLTRELLTFSRKQPLQLRPTNLNGVIDQAVPMLSRLVGKGITVWVQLPPDVWPIPADAGQLEQVLVNLASNARDAMPHGGKLLLETTNVMLEDKHAAMPPGDYVLLAVSDTGLGIPQHILPRIFEPFFTTKEHGKGTGLGLASVYGIVKQGGGYIWAYSETGYGTTFKIYMPRAAASKLPGEEPLAKLLALRASNSSS